MIFLLGAGFGNAPALAKDVWVAQVAPFGGALAQAGRDFNLGITVALNEINMTGGVNGNRLRLVSRDDGYRSKDTVSHAREILQKYEPVAFLGMWGAENISAVLQSKLLESKGVPVIGVTSGMAEFRITPALFHIRAGYKDEVSRILDQMQTMATTRIAVVYEDEAFGREAWDQAQKMLAARQLKPATVVALPSSNVDVAPAVTQIVAADPQAVLLVANTPVAGAVISGIRGKGLKSLVFATSTVNAEQLVKQLGAAASGTAIAQGMPSPYRIKTPVAQDFRKQIVALGIDLERMNFASLEGYVATRVLAEGLRRAGRDVDAKALAKTLESMRRYDLGGFWIDFSAANHEGSRYVDMSIVGDDGRIRQ
ncbi:ABC transporter substrate-binding protein [Rhodoferax sp.]|uniref:ABC transporter substrate-binding protein n=1 Tax=Rhodoferax sp. TaxID=50421 RepID=UPI0025D6E32B|nr:ABC transporter substrate-binding protein [Rhodoferax sp.]